MNERIFDLSEKLHNCCGLVEEADRNIEQLKINLQRASVRKDENEKKITEIMKEIKELQEEA